MAYFTPFSYQLVNWRYCMKCQLAKPPRTHHCSYCGRCVMRMDHHCPWIGNCVGLYNHKIFLMFVLHATIGCSIVFAVMFHHWYNYAYGKIYTNMNYCAVILTSFSLIFSLGGLFFFHSYLIAMNKSTLEMSQLSDGNPFCHTKKVLKNKADRKARDPIIIDVTNKKKTKPNAHKDAAARQMKEVIDWWANITDTMGHEWWHWGNPFKNTPPNCDGINWYMKGLH